MSRRTYGNASHRVKVSPTKNRAESLRHAMRAVVAAQEWEIRGEDGQFIANTLDQVHLAYRFLQEILVKAGRVEADTEDDDDD